MIAAEHEEGASRACIRSMHPEDAVSSIGASTRSGSNDISMTEHRYPPSAMVSDYLVSGAGLALTVPPLAMFELPALTVWILGPMSLGFAIHGIGVARRQHTRVGTDEDGVWFSPPRRRIAWNEVTRFGLSYFSTRRDGARGWMELKLASPAATLRVDSRLERFNELVGRVWTAASRCGVEPDPTTRANLEALGMAAGEPDSGPSA